MFPAVATYPLIDQKRLHLITQLLFLRMNVINFKRVRDELKKSFSMDRDGSAIVLDLTSGELVAFSGAVSYSKAADRAGSFYVIWNAQDQSASQHDNKLEV